jgi:hypothetical protein
MAGGGWPVGRGAAAFAFGDGVARAVAGRDNADSSRAREMPPRRAGEVLRD